MGQRIRPSVNRRWLLPWLLLLLLLPGDGRAGQPPTGGPAVEPDRGSTSTATLAARATATTEFGLISGGDYAGAWRLWTPRAQQGLGLDEYLRRTAHCARTLGVPVTIVDLRQDAPDTVTIRWTRAGHLGSSRLRYLAGRWRFEPGDADRNPCPAG